MRVSPVRLTVALVVSFLGVAAYGCAQHVGGGDGEGGASSSTESEFSSAGGDSVTVEGTGGGPTTTVEGSGGDSSVTSSGSGGDSGGVRTFHAAAMLASDVGGPVLFSHKQIALLIGSYELSCTNHLLNVHDNCPFWQLQTNVPLDELVPGRVFPLSIARSEQTEPWGHDGSCIYSAAFPKNGTVTIDAVDDQSVSFTVSGTDDDWPFGHQVSDGSYRAPRCDF